MAVSEIAKRSPAFGALVASLPLVSLLAIIWLWRDTGDTVRIANHAEATFWYVLPSMPMQRLFIPALVLSFVVAAVSVVRFAMSGPIMYPRVDRRGLASVVWCCGYRFQAAQSVVPDWSAICSGSGNLRLLVCGNVYGG
jgi:hypothetical protein